MAFPVVESVTQTVFNTAATTFAVPMPATVNAGDLLLVVSSCGAVITEPAEFTEFWTQVSNTVVSGAFYRIAVGNEDGLTYNFTTAANRKLVVHTYRISAWHGTTPPEGGTAATGNSTLPNPPSLAPSWGSEDTLWLAVGAANGANAATDYPDNYTNGIDDNATAIGASMLATCRRELAATSDDPTTFTVTTNTWVAQTIAIRPAAGGGATVTPAVVATVVTVPTPTVLAASNVTPAVVPLAFVVPTPLIAAAANVTPAVVATTTTVPTPTVAAGAVVTPAVVATVATVPTPTVAAGDTVVTPAVVATVTTVPTPTIAAGAVVSPATVVTTVTVPNPTVAGEGIGNPATVAVVSTVPTPTIVAGSLVTPAVVAATTTVPTPSIAAAATVTPAVVAMVTTVPTPVAQGAVSVAPATVVTVTTVPTPSVTAGATVTPAVIPLAFTIPTPTIQSGLIPTITLPASGTITDADHEATIGNGNRVAVLTGGNRTGTIR